MFKERVLGTGPMMRLMLPLVLVACASGLVVGAGQQTDADKFAEGRVALDKFKDCPAALRALEGVSAASRQQPLWVLYMAKTHECLGNLSSAIEHYRAYAAIFPGQIEITERIAELQYRRSVAVEKGRLAIEDERLGRTLTGEWSRSYAKGEDFTIQIDQRGDLFVGVALHPRIEGAVIDLQGRKLVWPNAGETVLELRQNGPTSFRGRVRLVRTLFISNGDDSIFLIWSAADTEGGWLGHTGYGTLHSSLNEADRKLLRQRGFSEVERSAAEDASKWADIEMTLTSVDWVGKFGGRYFDQTLVGTYAGLAYDLSKSVKKNQRVTRNEGKLLFKRLVQR